MIDFTNQIACEMEINRLAMSHDYAGIEHFTELLLAFYKKQLLDSGYTEQDWKDMLHRVCPPAEPYPIQVELKIEK